MLWGIPLWFCDMFCLGVPGGFRGGLWTVLNCLGLGCHMTPLQASPQRKQKPRLGLARLRRPLPDARAALSLGLRPLEKTACPLLTIVPEGSRAHNLPRGQ